MIVASECCYSISNCNCRRGSLHWHVTLSSGHPTFQKPCGVNLEMPLRRPPLGLGALLLLTALYFRSSWWSAPHMPEGGCVVEQLPLPSTQHGRAVSGVPAPSRLTVATYNTAWLFDGLDDPQTPIAGPGEAQVSVRLGLVCLHVETPLGYPLRRAVFPHCLLF